MAVDVIVGLQRGDEGKGRFVDLVAPEYDVVARGNGSANAGHTVKIGDLAKIALHQIPSGIAHPGKLNIIGNGVYLDPVKLVAEIDHLQQAGIEVNPSNLMISTTAHFVMPHHVMLDESRESGCKAQGSTKSGVAYVAQDKYLREGSRTEELLWSSDSELRHLVIGGLRRSRPQLFDQNVWEVNQTVEPWVKAARSLEPFLGDTVSEINTRLRRGDRILAEGAQAFWLDINHGQHPYVTSSSTTVAGLLDGIGVAPKHLGKVTGVAKLVKSHVGSGPFVTEIHDEALAEAIRGPEGAVDSEYGASTGRPRRIGYPDLVELKNAVRVNGVDELVFSKMDHAERYGETLKVAVGYILNEHWRDIAPSSAHELENCTPDYEVYDTWSGDFSAAKDFKTLPPAAAKFIELAMSELETPVTMIGVGPERNKVVRL